MKLLLLTPILGLTALTPSSAGPDGPDCPIARASATVAAEEPCCLEAPAARTAAGVAAASAGHIAFECDGEELADCLRELDAGPACETVATSACCEAQDACEEALTVVGSGSARSVGSGSARGVVGSGSALVRARADGDGSLGERIRSQLERVFAGDADEQDGHDVLVVGRGEGRAPRAEGKRALRVHRSSDGGEPQILHLEQDGSGGVLRLGEGQDVRVLELDGGTAVEVRRLGEGGGPIEVVVRSGDGEPEVLRLEGHGRAHGAPEVRVEKRVVVEGDGKRRVIVGHGDGEAFVWKDGEGRVLDREDLDRELRDLDELHDLHELHGLHVLDGLHELHDLDDLHEHGLHGLELDLEDLEDLGDGQRIELRGLDGLGERLHGRLRGLGLGGGVRVLRPDSEGTAVYRAPRAQGRASAPRVRALGLEGSPADREVEVLLEEMRRQVEELEAEIESLRRELRELRPRGAR